MEGYEKIDFMTAVKMWDISSKKVVCVYRQSLIHFSTTAEWRSDFKVHAGLILEGEWYREV